MKNKKKYIKKIDIFTLILHVIIIFSLVFISVIALRQNNLKMLELRDKVFEADKSSVSVETSLANLRAFVSSHMNTELPKLGSGKAIQLKYSYERAVNQEQLRFSEETAKTSQLAKQSCTGASNELSRIDCEQKFIKNNPVSPIKNIAPETYSIEFVSPRWSFDLAGWLILVTLVAILLLIARVVSLVLASKYLKDNYI